MKKMCEYCGKQMRISNTRSHSNIATKRKQRANLQRTRVDGTRVLLCTSCMKAITK